MLHTLNMYPEGNAYHEYFVSPSKYFVEPFEILPGLWYVGDKKVSCHLLDTGDGLILFDAGYPHTKHMLVESIYRAGFNPGDIKYLIISHAHYDHTGAAMEFKELYGCRIMLGFWDAEMIKNRPELTLYEHADSEYYIYPQADVTLLHGDIIECGKAKISCISTPGHTDGVMSFFFDWEGHKVGYFGGQGTNTLATKYYRNYNVTTDNRTALRNSALYVRNYEVDVVLGNHPSQSDTFGKMARLGYEGKNPFVDPTEWARRMDAIVRSVDRLAETDPLPAE